MGMIFRKSGSSWQIVVNLLSRVKSNRDLSGSTADQKASSMEEVKTTTRTMPKKYPIDGKSRRKEKSNFEG